MHATRKEDAIVTQGAKHVRDWDMTKTEQMMVKLERKNQERAEEESRRNGFKTESLQDKVCGVFVYAFIYLCMCVCLCV